MEAGSEMEASVKRTADIFLVKTFPLIGFLFGSVVISCSGLCLKGFIYHHLFGYVFFRLHQADFGQKCATVDKLQLFW